MDEHIGTCGGRRGRRHERHVPHSLASAPPAPPPPSPPKEFRHCRRKRSPASLKAGKTQEKQVERVIHRSAGLKVGWGHGGAATGAPIGPEVSGLMSACSNRLRWWPDLRINERGWNVTHVCCEMSGGIEGQREKFVLRYKHRNIQSVKSSGILQFFFVFTTLVLAFL